MPMRIVYKMIYPNRKIYVGMDLTNNINYFGSADDAAIARDFTPEQRRSFSVCREILWESEVASDADVRAMEKRLIQELGANNPAVGYNRRPKFNTAEPFSSVAGAEA